MNMIMMIWKTLIQIRGTFNSRLSNNRYLLIKGRWLRERRRRLDYTKLIIMKSRLRLASPRNKLINMIKIGQSMSLATKCFVKMLQVKTYHNKIWTAQNLRASLTRASKPPTNLNVRSKPRTTSNNNWTTLLRIPTKQNPYLFLINHLKSTQIHQISHTNIVININPAVEANSTKASCSKIQMTMTLSW